MLIDPDEPFNTITKELLDLLRDRYPDGLSAIVGDPKKLAIPAEEDEEDFVIDYGVPLNPLDLEEGWTDLDISSDLDTVSSKNLPEGATLAFIIRGVNETKRNFVVEPPTSGLADEEGEGDDTMMAVDDDIHAR